MLFCELLVTGVLQTKTAELLLRNQWRIAGRGPANPPPPPGSPHPTTWPNDTPLPPPPLVIRRSGPATRNCKNDKDTTHANCYLKNVCYNKYLFIT